jgi:O-antigen/teichoic acid export membrane protein
MPDQGAMPRRDSTTGSLKSRAVVGAVWLMLWRVVTRTMGLGSTLLLARILVPGDFGLLGMASAFSAAVDQLSQLGLADALVRRRGEDRAIYDTAFTLQLGRALLTAAVLAAGAPLAAAWFEEPRLGPVVLVLAGLTALSGLENIWIAEFRRDMRFDVQFRLLLAPRLAQVATTIPLAFALRSYWALLIGMVAAKVARLAMTYVVHPGRPRLRLAGWRELAGFSFWTWATQSASLIWDRCDPFVLGPRLGPARLGVYLLALELAMLPVTELIAPVADALLAAFSVAQKDGESSAHHAPGAAAALLLVTAPLALAISCASGDLVAVLLGPKWVEAGPLIAIAAWMCLFSPFSHVCSLAMIANGRVRANFVGNVVVSAVKLALLITAVSFTARLDVVAAATVLSVAVEACVYALLLRRAADVRLGGILGGVLRIAFALGCAASALAALGLGWAPAPGALFAAMAEGAAIGAVAAAAYLAVLLATWRLAGRPDGPEAQLLAIAAPRLRRLDAGFLRLRRAG